MTSFLRGLPTLAGSLKTSHHFSILPFFKLPRKKTLMRKSREKEKKKAPTEAANEEKIEENSSGE